MRTYETDILNGQQVDRLIEWFDHEIGTDFDHDEDGTGGHYLTFFELEANEVSKIRYYENNKLTDKWLAKDFDDIK